MAADPTGECDLAVYQGRIRLRHGAGEASARFAVFCAGLWSDRLAVAAGADRDPRIVPFRGAYLKLRTERALRVRNAPSPAATSALALATLIADEVEKEL